MKKSVVSPNHDPSVEQLSLNLLPPRTIASICLDQGYHNLSIHFSCRLTRSWHVKIHRNSQQRELHVPQAFENAPEEIKKALLTWAMLPKSTGKHHSSLLKEQKRTLELFLYTFLTENCASPKKVITMQKWNTRGTVYDLLEVFDSVNSHYFNNSLKAFLRWGSFASKTSFQKTRKDASGLPWHYITIAGIYNHSSVPRYAIESIMYHEMLHIHIPPRAANGKRVIHGSDFRTMEKAFPYYKQWRAWEKAQVPVILKSIQHGKKRWWQI